MTRAFTAIPIPEEKAEKLAELQSELPGKKVRPEKMHITFEFFKDLDELEVAEIKTFLEALDTKPFEVKMKGLGAFPSKSFIRVLWAGIDSSEIKQLFEKVSENSIDSDNDHEFRPHITLSRVNDLKKTEKKKVHQALHDYSDLCFDSFTADKLVLYESEMTSEGSRYRELYVKNL